MARHQSEQSHAILDFPSRLAKARKLSTILAEFKPLSECRLLDVGVGAGIITGELAKLCASVEGVDVVDERVVKDGYDFQVVATEELPFPDQSFDIVVSNHVVPHVRDQRKHTTELWRVLKPDGIAYVAAPNRMFDYNYRLPLVSMLPAALARPYFKAVYGKEYDIQPLSYFALRRLLGHFREVHLISERVLKRPENYDEGSTLTAVGPLVRAVPDTLLALLRPLIPTFIVVARR